MGRERAKSMCALSQPQLHHDVIKPDALDVADPLVAAATFEQVMVDGVPSTMRKDRRLADVLPIMAEQAS